MVEHILPGTQEQAEESPFAPLLRLTGPQKGQLAQRRQRMGPARRERPSPAHPFHVAVYIRYFNQTRYENYLELHKKAFADSMARCPNWDFVGFYIDEGSTAPRMESAKAWSRLLQDCQDGKVDLIVTQKRETYPEVLRSILLCQAFGGASPSGGDLLHFGGHFHVGLLLPRRPAGSPLPAGSRKPCKGGTA